MAWSRAFEEPIALPAGRELVTLEDAARYIMTLPPKAKSLPEWQTAVETLLMAAEGRGPLTHARIGVLRAINAGKPAPIGAPRRKRAKAYRVVK